MMPMTCDEVRDRLGLHAAHECDAPTQAAVDDHLAHCPSCARASAEARQVAGLLTLHFRAGRGLERLRERIEGAARPRRIRSLPFVRRLAAVAALLLVVFGVTRWVGSGLRPEEAGSGLELALTPARLPRGFEAVQPALVRGKPHPEAAFAGGKPLLYTLDLHGRTPAAYRRSLLAARDTPDLPPPPRVDLALRLRNDTSRPMQIDLGDRADLLLDLDGPGALSVPIGHPAFRPPGVPRPLDIPAGGEAVVPINRLVSRRAGQLRYSYWTAPGHYTLTVQLHATLSRDGGRTYVPFTLRAGPLPLEVRATP